MRTLTATFSTLDRRLNPHAKGSPWPKIIATRNARSEAFMIGAAEIGSGRLINSAPIFTKVKVSLTLYADTALARARMCYVPRDIQNLIAAVKPHIDGLKDAGWIKDDDKKAIIGYDEVKIITGKEAEGRCALVITFTEVEG